MSAAPVNTPPAPAGAYALPWPVVRTQLLRGAAFVLLLCLAIAWLLAATGRSGFAGSQTTWLITLPAAPGVASR